MEVTWFRSAGLLGVLVSAYPWFMASSRAPLDLVLVGGGHTHVQVLKDFAMEPPEGVRLTLVVDNPVAVYSGMVPGFVAGQYRSEELEIEVLPLARLAGARVLLVPATGIDPAARRLELAGRPSIPYDLVSFDIGSTVAGLDTPGVRDHAVPTRPIGKFVRLVDELFEGLDRDTGGPFRVVVVGGGAGGVELAFTLGERARRHGLAPETTLIDSGERILAGYPESFARKATAETERRGIRILLGQRVDAIDEDGVLAGAERFPYNLVVWVAGAAPHDVFRDSTLALDERGFLLTRPTLQALDYDDIFAAGDCATPAEERWVPKAGVYAVRQGPILIENLRKAIAGSSLLRPYRPQKDFLTLLNLGDGTAIGAKWRSAFAGSWVFKLKDSIDRKFMGKFQALSPAHDRADVSEEFSELFSMRGEMEMVCGGCAAKLGSSSLERTLERLTAEYPAAASEKNGAAGGETLAIELGLEERDDAVAFHSPEGSRIVSSVDQFQAFSDDPFLVGRVGAVNAVSDVLAKGVEPKIAQALIALPEKAPAAEREEILLQVLAGGRVAFDELGVVLVGGHTTTATELLVGFVVEGFADPDLDLLTLDRLQPKQTLILTKALGTGVVLAADRQGRARGRWLEAAIASMLRLNQDAAAIARRAGASAATDVTGFGFAHHLGSMLAASSLEATVGLDSLPRLPGAAELFRAGLRSTFHEENARALAGLVVEETARSHPFLPFLFDPQTSGGLLFGVDPDRAQGALEELAAAGYRAAAVGRAGPNRRDAAGPRLRIR